MKILITGGAGYVGSTIATAALKAGFQVRVIDHLWFNPMVPLVHYHNPSYEFIQGDITRHELLPQWLEGIDYVVHTAAVVGDPASKLFPELTKSVNFDASLSLLEEAARQKARGFIFFSTCSNYGVANGIATEESALNPLSLYAETKVGIEREILSGRFDLDWIICRLSTVYGSAARMRFDLTVNDFALHAWKNKYLDIFLPESYRPYIHVYDLASIIVQMIGRFDGMKHQVFNLGFNDQNYQKIQIANAVRAEIPEVRIEILKEGGDYRDYQVDFSKLQKFLPYRNQHTVDTGVREVISLLNAGMIPDPDAAMFYNTRPVLK